jgi:hypothetical protein
MAGGSDLTIAEARDALAKGEVSARELAEAQIAAVEAARPLNAFITETPDQALEMAEASDRAGEAGLLEGIPLAIKDLFCTEGVPTTAGSHILDGFTPPYESTVTANLWRNGAIMLGKTNLDEFAMGSSNMTSYHGAVESPWRRPGDRHRHRRLDPPAGRVLRHRRHEADLWPLLALGRGRLRLFARSARTADADGARRRDHARRHGRARPQGFDQRRYPGARLRGGAERGYPRA